ncbi:hypothetical protein [Streptomyces fractus]|uniref:hypothetical protein n=1 Tax=Streptomyces fractus TaxID=641806 RepID=UPI003CF10D88
MAFETLTRFREALAPGGRLLHTPPPQAPVRRPEMRLPEIRREAVRLLPGSEVRQLLFWRYLLTYTR